jgi:hypothetical protein
MSKRIPKVDFGKNRKKDYYKDNRKILKSLDHTVNFSFQFLETNDKFNLNDCKFKYFITLFNRLVYISKMNIKYFREKKEHALKNHRIDWEYDGCTEDGFNLKGPYKGIDDVSFQFGLGNNKNGRILGFIQDNVFYVRWFDPKHKLYKLNENEDQEVYDKDFLELQAKSFSKSDQEWAARELSKAIEKFEDKLEQKDDDYIELLNQFEEKEEIINEIQDIACDNCLEKIGDLI